MKAPKRFCVRLCKAIYAIDSEKKPLKIVFKEIEDFAQFSNIFCFNADLNKK